MMRKSRKVAVLCVLCMMAVTLLPTAIVASDDDSGGSRTPLSVVVPEQPDKVMVTSTDHETLSEVDLPEGWTWKEPDTNLVLGDYVEAIAIYQDGVVTVEKTIKVGKNVQIVITKTDTVYVIGSDTDLVVTCTGELSALRRVEMDGTEVSDDDYSKRSGSTILMFTKSYMDTLQDGEHTITLTYPVGSVSTVVQVSTGQEPEAPDTKPVKPDAEGSDTPSQNEGNETPGQDIHGVDTVDRTNIALWIAMVLISGTAGVGIIRRNLKKR